MTSLMKPDLYSKIERLVTLLEKILNLLESAKATNSSKGEWLDNVDIKKRLNISDSTIYRMRKKNILQARQISGKWYYRLPDFDDHAQIG